LSMNKFSSNYYATVLHTHVNIKIINIMLYVCLLLKTPCKICKLNS
jgi:hypothetical protein